MGVFDDLIRNASEVANSAAGAISHAADDAGKALKEKADEVGGAVSGAVSVAGEAIGAVANEAGNAAADYASAAQDAALAAANTAVTAVAGAANAAATMGADAAGAVAGTVGTVATIAGSAVSGAASAVEASVREMKEKEIASYRQNTLSHLGIGGAPWIILLEEAFGPSPTELTESTAAQAKEAFPIPREQHVLWLDAEFDLRPSGVALTECGVFVRSDVDPLQLDALVGGKQPEVASLRYVRWEYFDPCEFSSKTEDSIVFRVAKGHFESFVRACDELSDYRDHAVGEPGNITTFTAWDGGTPTVDAGVALAERLSADEAVFLEKKAAVNLEAGHGEMAEKANHTADLLHGKRAEWSGPLNKKNGADRIVHENGSKVLIQTKYYNKWRGTLESGFDSGTGQYRYMSDGTPMRLEVPSDQYEQVLEGFRIKIRQGKVPGVSDPNDAEKIVKKGRLTYAQAKNLTKAGNIDSLKYDASTGVITCSCAMGITFVTTAFLAWNQTKDVGRAVQSGVAAGVQVFGLSFAQHMLISQIARTSFAKSLAAPSEQLVGRLSSSATRTIANGLRVISGQSTQIAGAAATKSLARLARSNALSAAVTMVVFSVPETYRLVSRKISGAQYTKNIAALAGSVVGGIGGAVAAGVAAAKVSGIVGTTVAPGVGTAVGIAGGFVGGTVGSLAVGTVGGILHEDDAETMGRLLNAIVSCLAVEYMLSEPEVDLLVERLNEVSQDDLKTVFEEAMGADRQEDVFRAFLSPIFDEIIAKRPRFALPSYEEIFKTLMVAAGEGGD